MCVCDACVGILTVVTSVAVDCMCSACTVVHTYVGVRVSAEGQ